MRVLFHPITIQLVYLTFVCSVSPSGGNHKNLIHYLNSHLHSANIDTAMLYKSLNISDEAELKSYLRKFLHVRHKKHFLAQGASNIRSLIKEELHRTQTAASVWPIKKEAVVEGDVILGGLMMVHSRSENVTCGPIMPQGGIQALETMLYTLDYINSQQRFNIRIGAHILDDCDQDTYGLEMALDFIKDSSFSSDKRVAFHFVRYPEAHFSPLPPSAPFVKIFSNISYF
ncbi:hypothetical protein M8J76_009428 [Diaphorina citri]|nr:hypothetical protein M8J76_009428 [Diaphorina citri]